MRRQAGFTLLEVLIALAIFTIIGAGAQVMLSSILHAREVERAHAAALGQAQKALWVMGQDVMQMDATSFSNAGVYAASFTRRGWANPMGLPRSDMMRVGYRLEGGVLSREYWPELEEGGRQVQAMLSGVKAFSLRAIGPRAVEIVVDTQDYGTLRRVVEVPDL